MATEMVNADCDCGFEFEVPLVVYMSGQYDTPDHDHVGGYAKQAGEQLAGLRDELWELYACASRAVMQIDRGTPLAALADIERLGDLIGARGGRLEFGLMAKVDWIPALVRALKEARNGN